MSFRGVHSSSPAPMHTIPSASTRRHFDSFELLRGATPKPQFLPTVDPITTGPTGKLREFGKRRREAGGRRAGHTGPINEHGDKGQQDTHLRPRDSEQVRDDRAPRDSRRAPARRLCRGNCAEAVCVKMNCVKMNCAKRLYRDSRIGYGTGRRPLRTAQTPPVSRAGFDTGCKPSRATRPLPRSARSRSAISNSIKSEPHSRHPTGRHPNIQGVRVKNRTVAARIGSAAESEYKKTPDS